MRIVKKLQQQLKANNDSLWPTLQYSVKTNEWQHFTADRWEDRWGGERVIFWCIYWDSYTWDKRSKFNASSCAHNSEYTSVRQKWGCEEQQHPNWHRNKSRIVSKDRGRNWSGISTLELSFFLFLSFFFIQQLPSCSEWEWVVGQKEKSKGCIIRLSLTAADRHLCLCASTHFPSLAFGPKCRTTYFLLQQILKWHSGLLAFHVHKGEGAWERQIKHRTVQIRAGEGEISLKNWILQLPKCSSIASSSLFFFRSSLTRGITTCFKLHTLKLAMQALSPATSFRKAPPGREKAFQSGETRGSEVKTAFITVDDTW